jgi:ribonuclease P protein component
VYQRGQIARGQLVTLRYVRNDRQTSYRVAVVVSRKVSKSAVVRNRIRRRLYEIVRKHASRITEPFDLVFTVYGEDTANMSHASLQKQVLGQLSRAGALSEPAETESGHDIVDKKETNT